MDLMNSGPDVHGKADSSFNQFSSTEKKKLPSACVVDECLVARLVKGLCLSLAT